MGPNKISRYQYDRRMQATTRVEWNSDHLNEVENSNSSTLTGPGRWIMNTNVVEITNQTQESPSNSSKGIDRIRQRGSRLANEPHQISIELEEDYDKKKKLSGYERSDEAVPLTTFESATETAARQARRDPANWFGVLSPAPLKNAQNSFQQAVLELTTSANLSQQLVSSQAKIQALQAKKDALFFNSK